MPRWSAALLAFAVCGPTAAFGELNVLGDTGAYNQRLQEWQAAQPPGTPPSNYKLVDGTYKGIAELVSAQGAACPAPRPGTIEIGDRWLVYPYQPNAIFFARAQADGSLAARLTAGTLEGRVADGWLQFTIHTPACETRYRLRWTM